MSTLAETIEEFVLDAVRSSRTPTSSRELFSQLMLKLTQLNEIGANFNEDRVLAIDVAKTYDNTISKMLNSNQIAKLYYTTNTSLRDADNKKYPAQFVSYLVPIDATVQIMRSEPVG